MFASLNEKEEFRIVNFQIALEDVLKNVLKMFATNSNSESSSSECDSTLDEIETNLSVNLTGLGGKENSSTLNSIKKKLITKKKSDKKQSDEEIKRSPSLTLLALKKLHTKAEKRRSKLYSYETLAELAVLLKNELDLSPYQVGNHTHKRCFSGN